MNLSILKQKCEGIIKECPICQLPFSEHKKVMTVCKQAHPICQECINMLAVDNRLKKCPSCSESFRPGDERPNRQANEIIQELLPLIEDMISLKDQQKISQQCQIASSMGQYEEEGNEEEGRMGRKRLHFDNERQIQMAQGQEWTEQVAEKLQHNANLEDSIQYFKEQVQNKMSFEHYDKKFIGLGNIEEVDGIYQGKSLLGTLTQMGLSINQVSVFELLSFCCMLSQEPQSHLNWYSGMIVRYPKREELLFGRANIYFLLRQYSDALKDYRLVSQILPKYEKVIQACLLTARQMFQFSKWRKIMNLLLSIAPQNKFALLLPSLVGEPSLETLSKLEEKYSQDPYALLQIAKAYDKLNNLEKYKDLTLKALLLNPHYEQIYYCQAYHHIDRKRQAKAIDDLLQLIKSPGKRRCQLCTTYNQLGVCYDRSRLINKHQKALEAFQKSNQIKPNKTAQEWIGGQLYSLGRYQEALEIFRSIQPNSPDIVNYYDIGLCLKRLKNYQEAIKYFTRAAELRLQRSYPLLIDCYRMLMNYPKAIYWANKWGESESDEDKNKAALLHLQLTNEYARIKLTQALERWS